ncbi:hypothetical protein [Leptobacterium sp. I13]|uniref:hypothetical protein n=1 Tax=Leptobacterium meishanense TaxID=3128904 RepID=UPI0030EBA99D
MKNRIRLTIAFLLLFAVQFSNAQAKAAIVNNPEAIAKEKMEKIDRIIVLNTTQKQGLYDAILSFEQRRKNFDRSKYKNTEAGRAYANLNIELDNTIQRILTKEQLQKLEKGGYTPLDVH